MKTRLSQQDLKQVISDVYKKPVRSVSFDLGTKTRGSYQRDMEEVPVFESCTAEFEKKLMVQLDEKEFRSVVSEYFDKKGYVVNPEYDIRFNMSMKYTGETPLSRKATPVFKDCAVDYQEKKADIAADMDNQKFSSLAEMRREEHYRSLMKMPDRDMCEMVRSHFESHPTLPGEKELKEKANYELAQIANNDLATPFDGDMNLDPAVKESMARKYADTRIREFSVCMAGINPEDLNRKPVIEIPQKNATVYISRVDVELQKQTSGDIYVLAEKADGRHITIGSLPDGTHVNNPMNVESCKAELQIADYSNGKMKNLSTKVVADTDLMSGDVIDLNDDMLSGFDQIKGLEQ